MREENDVGPRILVGELYEQFDTMVLAVRTLQQVRGHVEHFRAPNAMWEILTGPIDLIHRYTDGNAIGG